MSFGEGLSFAPVMPMNRFLVLRSDRPSRQAGRGIQGLCSAALM